MTKRDLIKLEMGDVISHKSNDNQIFIVVGKYSDCIVAVDVAHITNPREWWLVRKASDPIDSSASRDPSTS